jgi:small subunit ribosomal protein S6
MRNERTNYYEAMFVISQAVAADLNGAIEHIKGLLDRAGAEVVALRKWDERRLAFEIGGQKRAVFILAYFKCLATKMTDFDRDCNLSEKILRVLVTKADHLTIEEMQSADSRQQLADEAAIRGAGEDATEIEFAEEEA